MAAAGHWNTSGSAAEPRHPPSISGLSGPPAGASREPEGGAGVAGFPLREEPSGAAFEVPPPKGCGLAGPAGIGAAAGVGGNVTGVTTLPGVLVTALPSPAGFSCTVLNEQQGIVAKLSYAEAE